MKDLIREKKENIYLDNSIYMELIDELATEMTQLYYGDDTYATSSEVGQEEVLMFQEDAHDYYNEKYDDIEILFNNLGNIYSKNKHEI